MCICKCTKLDETKHQGPTAVRGIKVVQVIINSGQLKTNSNTLRVLIDFSIKDSSTAPLCVTQRCPINKTSLQLTNVEKFRRSEYLCKNDSHLPSIQNLQLCPKVTGTYRMCGLFKISRPVCWFHYIRETHSNTTRAHIT